MQKRKLGASGPEVSLVGLGTNNFGGRIGRDAARRVVDTALDLGVTLIDTADIYGNKGGSESILGEVLGSRRKNVVLATKFGLTMGDGKSGGASRRYIVQAAEASLRRLNTDWIDLYQLHRPDAKTPIEETLRALDDLVKAGKVRCIGCSNFSAIQLEEAQTTAARHELSAFVTCQDEYNLLDRAIEKDRVAVMQRYGLGLFALFPAGKRTAQRQIPARSAHAGRFPAVLQRPARRRSAHPRELGRCRTACRVCRGAGPLAPGISHELACRTAVSVEHHRRRHDAGSGRTERRGGRMASLARRSRRDRQYYPLIDLGKSARRIHGAETSVP